MYPASRIWGILFSLALLMLIVIAAATTNTVQLFVHPGSGTVCLDSVCEVNVGTLEGYSSIYFEGIESGKDHTVRVYNTAGYEDYSETLYMDLSGNPLTSRIYLEPFPTETQVPPMGDIQVYVSPGLGQVCLDAKECESCFGEPTTSWSVRFSDVSSDITHTITVTADGYQPFSTQVAVRPGLISNEDISLQPVGPGTTSAVSAHLSPVTAQPPPTKAAPAGLTALCAAAILIAALVNTKK
jgi:hypothetical protein